MLPSLPSSDPAAAEPRSMSHTSIIARRAVVHAAGTDPAVIPVRGGSASGAATFTSGTGIRIGGVAGSALPVAVIQSAASAPALTAIGTGDKIAFIASPLLTRGSRHTSGI